MTSGDVRDRYCEEELRPLLEEITTACMQDMPEDPKAWMRQWLAERLKARGTAPPEGSPLEHDGNATDGQKGNGMIKGKGGKGEGKDAKGKGAGKGHGKTQGAPSPKGKAKGGSGPPPPPLGGVGKSASKGAAKPASKGKGASTSVSEKRPGPAEAWKAIKAQSLDGHFEAEALAEAIVAAYKAMRLGVIANAKEKEIRTSLQEAHPTVPTGMVLAFVQCCVPDQPTSAKTRLQMYIKYNKPACGNQFYPKAKAWFEAQDKPSDAPSMIAALWKKWFDFPFEAVLRERIMPEISDESEEPVSFDAASSVMKDMHKHIGVVDRAVGKGAGKGDFKGSGKPVAERIIEAPKPKQVKKPGRFEAWKLIGAQSEDGHFEVDAFAQALSGAHRMVRENVSADVFLARLQALHPAVPTGMVLAFADKQLPSNPTSAKNRIQMYAAEMKPACGEEFINTARDWFESQDVPDDISVTISSLWSEWFDFEVKADYSRPLNVVDYGIRKKVKGTMISDEERQKKVDEQRRRSLEVKKAEAEKAKLWRGLAPRECLDEVPWREVMRTRWCSGGSGGATLVQVGNGEAVVLKLLGMSAVAEVMAAEVGRLAGVRVAGYALLERDSLAMPQVLAALRSAPMDGATVDSVVRRMEIADFIMVMEFVPGTVLQGLDGQRLLTADGASKLHAELGALIALDCLLNNVDRVPAIWMNEGNLSNVMITEGGIVGIDHQVNAIGNPDGKRQYFALLSEFCSDCAENRVASPSALRVKNAILENTGVSLDDAALTTVLDGARTIFRRVKDERDLVIAGLSGLEPKMKKVFGSTTADVGLASFSKISGFVAECVETVVASSC